MLPCAWLQPCLLQALLLALQHNPSPVEAHAAWACPIPPKALWMEMYRAHTRQVYVTDLLKSQSSQLRHTRSPDMQSMLRGAKA